MTAPKPTPPPPRPPRPALPRTVEVTFDNATWQPAELTHEYVDGRGRIVCDGYYHAVVMSTHWREVTP